MWAKDVWPIRHSSILTSGTCTNLFYNTPQTDRFFEQQLKHQRKVTFAFVQVHKWNACNCFKKRSVQEAWNAYTYNVLNILRTAYITMLGFTADHSFIIFINSWIYIVLFAISLSKWLPSKTITIRCIIGRRVYRKKIFHNFNNKSACNRKVLIIS